MMQYGGHSGCASKYSISACIAVKPASAGSKCVYPVFSLSMHDL